MTEEEFYIWLINNKFANVILPEFNPEFLKKYEISKLVLDKFGIHVLSEEKQRSLNFEAVYSWLRNSRNIKLEYDIPEILELLPEKTVGRLDLKESKIKSLPNLKSVGGNLILWSSQIQSLPKLESVGGYLNLSHSQIQSLPKLKIVKGDLDLRRSEIQSLPELKSVEGGLNLENSQIQSLPELRSVEDYIYSKDKINYWENYFTKSERLDLAEKVRR